MKAKIIEKRTLLTILFLLMFQAIFSQENYITGYIVSFKGDTLHGYIDYRNWEKNPKKISFKEKLTDDKVVFFPTEIKAFGVIGDNYESAIIKTEVSPVKTGALEYDKDLRFETDTTFLQVLLKGEKSLFAYTNRLGEVQFYIKMGSSYELLVYKRYLEEKNDQTIVSENNKYLGQLSYYLNDCPSVRTKLPTTKYSRRSIENLFLFYDKCTNSKIDFQKKVEDASIQFGVIAGLSTTSLKFSSIYKQTFAYLLYANLSNSINVTGGLYLDYLLPRNLKKWSVCTEFLYSSYKFDATIKENNYSTTYFTLGYSYLKMVNMVRYKYPVGKCILFINGGISSGYAISSTNYKRVESELYGVETGKALDSYRGIELGLTLGIGAEFQRYSFELLHERGNGMSTYTSLSSNSYRYYFLVGYRF